MASSQIDNELCCLAKARKGQGSTPRSHRSTREIRAEAERARGGREDSGSGYGGEEGYPDAGEEGSGAWAGGGGGGEDLRRDSGAGERDSRRDRRGRRTGGRSRYRKYSAEILDELAQALP